MVDATVLVQGRRIVAVGPRMSVAVPPMAHTIRGQGLFVLPGFIDTNVHISKYASGDTDTTRLNPRTVRAVRDALQFGVTTIRDSYGVLVPLRMVRDSLRAGHLLGARLFIAGNIVGWGGPDSYTFLGTPPMRTVTPALIASVTQDVGEDLVTLEADSLRQRIEHYLEKGVDFIKYGGTVHDGDDSDPENIPNLILFSDRAQRIIVDAAHRRGLSVETHATSPEGLRMAIMAGVDLVQHPEAMASGYLYSDQLAQLLVRRHVICSMLSARAIQVGINATRRNAEKLIRMGCTVSVATDGPGGQETLAAIEALVTLGMTPMHALVAATRNGALACKRLNEFGTVEPGKLADLVVLRANPLADIHNIEQISMVFSEGRAIRTDTP